jgi:uncharacterized protein
MTQPNEDLVRQASAAFARGDLDALRNQFFAPNITWHISGTGPLAGDYQGIDAVMGLIGKIAGLSGGTARVALHDVVTNDAHTVSLAAVSAERSGKQLRDNITHVIHAENGMATEIWTSPGDPAAEAAFWS